MRKSILKIFKNSMMLHRKKKPIFSNPVPVALPDSNHQQSQSIPALSFPKPNTSDPVAQKFRINSTQNFAKRKDKLKRYSIVKQSCLINQVSKYSYATKKGISTNKNVPPKSKDNQDAYISTARFMDTMFSHFFGIWDGHGVNGKQVSSYIKKRLPQALNEEIDKHNLFKDTDIGIYPKSNDISDAIVSAFFTTNDDLHKQNFDVRFSGSTWISLFVIGKKLYWANVGDSRGILVKVQNLERRFEEYAKGELEIKHKDETKGNELKI